MNNNTFELMPQKYSVGFLEQGPYYDLYQNDHKTQLK